MTKKIKYNIQNQPTLINIKNKTVVKIVKIIASDYDKNRLKNLQIYSNTIIQKVNTSLDKKTILLNLNNTLIALSSSLCEKIIVSEVTKWKI